MFSLSSRNASQTAYAKTPSTTRTPASELWRMQTCSTASSQTTRWAHDRQVGRCGPNFKLNLSEFPLWSPAVVRRGVQPDVRSPSAGEHREEGRSCASADHEPKADQAGVLHRRQLSKRQIKPCQRAGRTPALAVNANFSNVKMYQGFDLHTYLPKFLRDSSYPVSIYSLLWCSKPILFYFYHTMKVDGFAVDARKKDDIRVSRYL